MLDRKLVDQAASGRASTSTAAAPARKRCSWTPRNIAECASSAAYLNDMNPPDAMEFLVGRLQKTKNERRVFDEHEYEDLVVNNHA